MIQLWRCGRRPVAWVPHGKNTPRRCCPQGKCWWQWSRELFVQLSADPTTEPDERTDAFPACGYDGGLVRHLFHFHADHPDDHQFERLSHWIRLGDCLHEWHSQPIAVHTRRSANAGTDHAQRTGEIGGAINTMRFL